MVDRMNDLPLYHKTFEALEVHERDRTFATTAKSLFDAAHRAIEWDAQLFSHLNKLLDSPQASQLFFENETEDGRYYDRLAISALPNNLIVGIEHRDFQQGNNGYRSSVLMSHQYAKAYYSDVAGVRQDTGSTERYAVEDFKNRFYAVTAAMGLFGHMKRLDTPEPIQNDNVSASFAKAA